MKDKIVCSHCGAEIGENEHHDIVDDKILCHNCVESCCSVCDSCNELIWSANAYGDNYTNLCQSCYENYYTRCSDCGCLLHEDDVYRLNGCDYCHECYDDECDKCNYIHNYNYKPEPIFYGDSDRYFGVELEIDMAGKDDDHAEELLNIANRDGEFIYIKADSSLEDGMEIVSHPMSLDCHKDFCWENIMYYAVRHGYRSHQTSTCGLHIHVNRDSLADIRDEQDEVISRILYFIEHHWNEMLIFSRRSEYTMNRWAARYGYENDPKAILEKAK